MKATLKDVNNYNEEYGANCTLFEIEVSTFTKHGGHLSCKEDHKLVWQTDDYKEALELYNREKWSQGSLCKVYLKRAQKFKDEIYYADIYKYTSPDLKYLSDRGYYVLY